jgi:hypothetical protein
MSEPPPGRFPPPWHADPMPGGYVVRDGNGQAHAFVYSRDNDAEARLHFSAWERPPESGCAWQS